MVRSSTYWHPTDCCKTQSGAHLKCAPSAVRDTRNAWIVSSFESQVSTKMDSGRFNIPLLSPCLSRRSRFPDQPDMAQNGAGNVSCSLCSCWRSPIHYLENWENSGPVLHHFTDVVLTLAVFAIGHVLDQSKPTHSSLFEASQLIATILKPKMDLSFWLHEVLMTTMSIA